MIRVIADAQVQAARAAIIPGADLPSSVRNAFVGFWKLVEETPEAQLLTYELTSWALRNADTEPLAREQRESQLAGIEQILAEISAACGVSWSVPPGRLARMTLAITDGVTLGWLVDRDTDAAVQVLETFVDHLLQLAS